ncbi:MAG: Mrp/NBP35 family ATP-binding protein [Acutalibacteraceae bacterium]|nr:Mrp/NBP35 family ATP-binding protein [Acutalibacteraceae bacterium]
MSDEKKNQGCSGNCSSCSQSCSERDPKSLIEPTGEYNNIKHVIGVVSGKGGVGKSMVTSMLAVLLNRMGYKVGILDADITGPSIPKTFGINSRAMQNEIGVLPAETKTGIKLMSINLMLADKESPVLWRGPVIAGAVKQFWHDVVWGDLDYLLIDCPPGTGDVPLTVFQSIPLDGAVIVTSPQDHVSMIVKKAYNMANMMDIPVLGIVENMSYVVCPDCGKSFNIFGSGSETVAEELGVPLLGKMPIDVSLAQMVDNGEFERFEGDYLKAAVEEIINKTR